MANHDARMVTEHIGDLAQLKRDVLELSLWKAGVMIEHQTLKEGVANFREFQTTAKEFFNRQDERAKTEKEFHNKRDAENKEAMEARHRQNQEKLAEVEAKVADSTAQLAKKTLIWNIAGVFVAIAALIVGGLGVVVAVKLSHFSNLHEIIHFQSNYPVYSLKQNQSDSSNSAAYTAQVR